MKLKELEPRRTTKDQRIIVRRQFDSWRRGTIELNGRSYRRWYRQQKNKQYGKCFYCSTKLVKTEIEVDHRIPVYKGGTNDGCNLVLACKECNRFKSTYVLMRKRQTRLKEYQKKVLSC
jgi:5-methylcytosine-specific restriction endonuclease McrA